MQKVETILYGMRTIEEKGGAIEEKGGAIASELGTKTLKVLSLRCDFARDWKSRSIETKSVENGLKTWLRLAFNLFQQVLIS